MPKIQVYGPGRRTDAAGQDVLMPIWTPPGQEAPEIPVHNPENPVPGIVETTDYLFQAYALDINDRMRDGRNPSLWTYFDGLSKGDENPGTRRPSTRPPVRNDDFIERRLERLEGCRARHDASAAAIGLARSALRHLNMARIGALRGLTATVQTFVGSRELLHCTLLGGRKQKHLHLAPLAAICLASRHLIRGSEQAFGMTVSNPLQAMLIHLGVLHGRCAGVPCS